MLPAVRDLQALVEVQNKGLKPQYDLIDQSITQNETSGAAQVAGLEAVKGREFKQIGQRSQDKGMFFSGFSPNEEAEYTAGTYLPALAQLQGTIAQTRAGLLGKKADLGTKAFDIATGQQEQDIDRQHNFWLELDKRAHETWRTADERAYLTAEAEKQRIFEASEKGRDRAAQAAQSQGAPAALVTSISTLLNNKKGKDTFVAPETYRQGKQQWTAAGGSPDSYDATFSGYINPDHQNKFGGYL